MLAKELRERQANWVELQSSRNEHSEVDPALLKSTLLRDNELLESIFKTFKNGVTSGDVISKIVLERVLTASLVECQISVRTDRHEEVDLIVFSRVVQLAAECPGHDFGLSTMPDIFMEELKSYHSKKVKPMPGLFNNEKGIEICTYLSTLD